jgi:hypothetical protein
MTQAGAATFTKILKMKHLHNNNWLLHALRRCHIYVDDSCELNLLEKEADTLFHVGPASLSADAQERVRIGLAQRLHAAQLLVKRACSSNENRVLARIRCDQLVSNAMYLSFCVRRKWTTSLPRLLQQCRRDYPELYLLWSEYCAEQDPANAIRTVEKILDYVWCEPSIEVQQNNNVVTRAKVLRRLMHVNQ